MSMSAEVTTARLRLEDLIRRRDEIESELIQDGAYDNQECLKAKDDNANNQMTLKAGVTRQSSLPAKLHQTNQVMTLPLQRIHIPKPSINKSKSLIDTITVIPGGLKL